MRTFACLALLAAAAAAQMPRFRDANVVAASGLNATLAQAEHAGQPSWIGFTVPAQPGRGHSCGVEYLESDAGRPAAPSAALTVLLRIEGGAINRVHAEVDPECWLDAGGLTVRWLGPVAAADSARLLAEQSVPGALAALGMSAGAAATDAIIALAQHGPSDRERGQALFWLSQRASDRAVGVITAAVRDDPSTAVKERAVFGLSQLPDGQGVPILIGLAQNNANPVVRKRAMFWLGQSKDPRALAFFRRILLP